MFYPYNENLIKEIRNRKPSFITYIADTIFIIIAFYALLDNNTELFIFMVLFTLGYNLLSYFDLYLASRHPAYKVAKYRQDLELFKANGVPLGAKLNEDYLLVRGLLFTEVCKNEVYINEYFIERKIYYKDIKSFAKTKYTSFIDFRDSNNPRVDPERFFISYFFDNSDKLLSELHDKVTHYKNSNKI